MTRLLFLAALLAAAPLAAAQTPDSTAADTSVAEALSPAEASARFLAEVAQRPGVQQSRTGLLWTVEREGSGQRPTRGEAGIVTYVGRLWDGPIFDAGGPVRLPIRGVVPGFAEALQEMRPGETRTVYMPPALAYGRRGVPGRIPPDAALVFEITLVRVVP